MHTGPTHGRSHLQSACISLPAPSVHCPTLLFSSLSLRRTHRRLQLVHPARPPSGLPAGSKTDASFEALVSPERHALALTGSRVCELAPTLTIEFQDNVVRCFTCRPVDGRLDLHPAAALPAQPRRQPQYPGRPHAFADAGRATTSRSRFPAVEGLKVGERGSCPSPQHSNARRFRPRTAWPGAGH